MSDILEYFDNISIDVAKRKYYNANKVNMVLEELREQAEELVEENERLRAELARLQDREKLSSDVFSEMQSVYRDTLEKAHQRADRMVEEAEEYSRRLNRDAELKTSRAARQLEECINAVRRREEQNIVFLNDRLQAFLEELNPKDMPEQNPSPAEMQPGHFKPIPGGESVRIPRNVDEDEAPGPAKDPDPDISSKVGQIAEEIRALENETE